MSKVWWIIIGIIAVCLIAFAIGLVLYYAFRSDEAETPPTNGNPPPPPGGPPSNDGPPPPGMLVGTGTGPSTNKYLSVQCPSVQMDTSKLSNCTGLSYNNTTGIVTGSCKANSSSAAASTSLNMAQCNDCNITTRDGKLVCDIDYTGCPNVLITALDIEGNDLSNYKGTDDCVDHCDEDGCYFATYYFGDCFLKKTPTVPNYSSGFAVPASESCPSYYVIPNTRVPNYKGTVTQGLTLNQCQQKCKDTTCDWYEYNGSTGECNTMKGKHYTTSEVKTLYPIELIE